MFQQEKPNDYEVAIKDMHMMEELLELVFIYVRLNWKDHRVIDNTYFRLAKVNLYKSTQFRRDKISKQNLITIVCSSPISEVKHSKSPHITPNEKYEVKMQQKK